MSEEKGEEEGEEEGEERKERRKERKEGGEFVLVRGASYTNSVRAN